jgi:hypothetical protein
MRKPRGPDGWQMAMGAYAACTAVALYQTPEIMHQDAFSYLAINFSVIDRLLPAVMALYASASLVCLFFGTQQKRVALAMAGILLWTFLGSMMMAGSWIYGGFLSPAGMFEVLGGLGCFVSVLQLGDKYEP